MCYVDNAFLYHCCRNCRDGNPRHTHDYSCRMYDTEDKADGSRKNIHAFLSSKVPEKDLDLTTHRKLDAPNDEKPLEKFRSCKGAVGLQLHGTTN